MIFLGESMQEKMHMRQHPGIDPPPFVSEIVDIQESNIFLKSTYCYPRGGGQPGDTGIIESKDSKSRMQEVISGDLIPHPVEEADLFDIGELITCHIDVERRNRHTRMHTAQHIVSAIAEDIWGAETVGNQLTIDKSRVDLLFEDKSQFDPDELVSSVNDILSQNIPVNIHQWSREQIMEHEQMRHTKFMDRIPSSVKQLRVVEVEGIDLCPCAGTHVDNTENIPFIEYVGKKNKGKGRIRFSYTFEKH
jgi:misacylated tRNA(Ala) deacylase